MKQLVFALALLAAAPALADSSLPAAYWANRQLPDSREERQAQALMEEIRCLVCQGQSIADSDAELAGDMRDMVRRRIAAGEKPAAIRSWLIQRYGAWITFRPARRAADLAAVAGAAGAARRRRSNRPNSYRTEARQMNGWIALGLLVAASIGGLWLLRVRGAVLMFALSALIFGCVGYVVQGQPMLAGSPREVQMTQAPPIPLAEVRHAFFGNFTGVEHWLLMSEALAARGETEDAVGVLRAAVREHPRSPQIWVGLGNALVDHAGVLTPASQYAYQHAAELAPGHPAPMFFMGLALARSGDREGALALWKELLASAPADASWRPMVEDAVAALGPASAER